MRLWPRFPQDKLAGIGLVAVFPVIGWRFIAPSLLHNAVENSRSVNTGEGAHGLPDFHKSCGFSWKRGCGGGGCLRLDIAPVS
jgi:hypothetical protein